MIQLDQLAVKVTSGSPQPATGYIDGDGDYVIVNDASGKVVQVSNKNDPNWRAPWE
jgi:hypothetical protein